MASFAKISGVCIAGAARGLTYVLGRRTGSRAAAHAAALLAPVVETQTKHGALRFRCASAMAARHAVDFARHEPETRRWIEDHVGAGEHLWDIGANVGLYTLYSALREEATVTAFEPVATTFAQLTENVALNDLCERVVPLCVALSNKTGVDRLFLASAEPGTAMHALGAPANVAGRFNPVRIQQVPAFRAEDLATQLQLKPPRHVKIDVDGHELRVLEGFGTLLNQVRTIWIEIETGCDGIQKFLVQRGFEARASSGGRNRLFVRRRP